MNMKERDVLKLLVARADNYTIADIAHVRGRLYALEMNGEHYTAVVLVHSYHFYTLRYHIALSKPTIIVCFVHDTVCSIPVISLRSGNFAQAYELPEEITNVEQQRHSKTGSQVLLGMYLCGMRQAQTLVKELPESTRTRYLSKARVLGRRTRGKPVGLGVGKKREEKPNHRASLS